MGRKSATYISRYIGETIDNALLGDNTVVTRYGKAVAEFTSDIPVEPGVRQLSVTEFLATVGHWLGVVEQGESLILTRRDRPVVAVVPFKPALGGFKSK